MTTDQGGGPIKYILSQPCHDGSSGNGQLALFVPPAVLESVSAAQRGRIALIQTRFAQRVSALLAAAYEEIGTVVVEGDDERE